MSDQSINYDAVIADLEAKKAQLDAAIAAIRAVANMPSLGTLPPGGGGAPYQGGAPAHDAFIGMSIPEAAKKHLSAVRKKQSTQDLMTALEAGGLPSSKYSTVYNVLRRRELQIGDIINLKGDWALAEWYPNYRKGKKDSTEADDANKEPAKAEIKSAKAATA